MQAPIHLLWTSQLGDQAGIDPNLRAQQLGHLLPSSRKSADLAARPKRDRDGCSRQREAVLPAEDCLSVSVQKKQGPRDQARVVGGNVRGRGGSLDERRGGREMKRRRRGK